MILRRALWRSSASRAGGSSRSQSRPAITIPMAIAANSIGSGAAGRAREEDDAIGVARHLVEGPDHARLAAAAGRVARHRGPQPEVELAAELGEQARLVLGDLDVSLREQHLTVAGFMRRSLILRRLWQSREAPRPR